MTRTPPRLLRLEDRLTPAIATWDGGGLTNNLWSNPLNWVGDVAPQPGDDLVFGTAAQTTSVNDFAAGTLFRSLAITASNFTLVPHQISGNSISLNAGIVGNNAEGSTIALDITLAASQIFSNVSGSGFRISGGVNLNGQILTVTVNGSAGSPIPFPSPPASVTISGTISGNGGIINDGIRGLVLSGNNTFTGPIDHRAGSLSLGSNSAAGATGPTNQTQVQPAAVLSVADGLTIPESITFANAAPTNQNPMAVGNTPVTFTGPITLTGRSRWLGEIVIAGGLFGTGQLSVQGSLTFAAGSVSTYNGTLNAETRFFLFNGTGPIGQTTANASQGVFGNGSIGPLTVQGVANTHFSPGTNGTVGTLTTGSLILGAIYDVDLDSTGADKGVVNGTVTLAGSVVVNAAAGFTPPAGSVYRIIDNDGTDFVAGGFGNLPQGAVVATVNGVPLYINYRGGTGNDVELSTTQPPPLPGPRPFFAVGAGETGSPLVNVYDESGVLVRSFFAYDAAFRGGVHVAVADVTGDGIRDIITAPGFGGGPVVRIWNGLDNALVNEYNAYDPAFRGGVFVAAARMNDDPVADIITGAGRTGGPHVKVFVSATSNVLAQWLAYDPAFTGGVRVAGLDIPPGQLQQGIVVTGAGVGGGPHVRTWGGLSGGPLTSFFAYEPTFTGGIYVAAGQLSEVGAGDNNSIAVSPGAGRSAEVRVFDVNGIPRSTFLAYAAAFQGGATVAFRTLSNGTSEIVTGAGPGGGPHVLEWQYPGPTIRRSIIAFNPAFLGGVFVG